MGEEQRNTVLPCPLCGKSLRREFLFNRRRDRLFYCPYCKTELQVNFRRKETIGVVAFSLVVIGIFTILLFSLDSSFYWIALAVYFPLCLLLGFYAPAKYIYFTPKDPKESSPFSPEGMQRQSKLRKTQLFNIVTFSLTIAIIVSSIVFAVVTIFPAVSWNMSMFILAGVFVVVFFISFTVQHRRQEQRDNNFFKGNALDKRTNPQGEPQGRRINSRQLFIVILVIFMVILQTILLVMVYSK